MVTTQLVRCGECPRRIPLDEWETFGHICEVCWNTHQYEAHKALYGHEECRECDRVLMHEDEQRANLCRRCDGVADLWDIDTGDEDDAPAG